MPCSLVEHFRLGLVHGQGRSTTRLIRYKARRITSKRPWSAAVFATTAMQAEEGHVEIGPSIEPFQVLLVWPDPAAVTGKPASSRASRAPSPEASDTSRSPLVPPASKRDPTILEESRIRTWCPLSNRFRRISPTSIAKHSRPWREFSNARHATLHSAAPSPVLFSVSQRFAP